jgi:regulatory protein
MKITAVEPQKKNPHRFNVFLDGKFAFGADEDTIVAQRLVVGKEIDQQNLPNILFEAEIGQLLIKLYGLFSVRQRSEKEVRDYLKRISFKRELKGDEKLSEIVTERLIETLKEKGMINDEEFAKAWVDSRRRSKKKGMQAIKVELMKKGISREIINDKLQMINEDDEKSLAQEALEKKVRVWRNLDGMEFKKKGIEFLIRKGFEYETAKEVVENYLKDVV